ncbi:MAG: hypothetical protein AAF409_16720 [Pseudomonadota bacterium]
MDYYGDRPVLEEILWRTGIIDAVLDGGASHSPETRAKVYGEVALAAISRLQELVSVDRDARVVNAVVVARQRIEAGLSGLDGVERA